GIAAGNSETVAHPALKPTIAPSRASRDDEVRLKPDATSESIRATSDGIRATSDPIRIAAANAKTSSAPAKAWPMKIVASVQIGVAIVKVSAANSAPP